eukprot:6211316-Pleurochrysis_carterae.AAC.4
MFTSESSSPNSERAWSDTLSHLNVGIPWPQVWFTIGTFLIAPTGDETWFMLVHRALMLNGKESMDKECRPGGHQTESLLHLLSCPQLWPIRHFVIDLLRAMGTAESVTDCELLWLLGMTPKGELLPSTHEAVIRLYWRHVYAAMTRLKFDNEPFSVNWKQILQHGDFVLPASAAKQASTILLLQQQGVNFHHLHSEDSASSLMGNSHINENDNGNDNTRFPRPLNIYYS